MDRRDQERSHTRPLEWVVMNPRIANRVSGVLGMLASLWAIVGILASNVGAPWKILIGPFAVWLFVSSLLQFLGTGPRRKA